MAAAAGPATAPPPAVPDDVCTADRIKAWPKFLLYAMVQATQPRAGSRSWLAMICEWCCVFVGGIVPYIFVLSLVRPTPAATVCPLPALPPPCPTCPPCQASSDLLVWEMLASQLKHPLLMFIGLIATAWLGIFLVALILMARHLNAPARK